MLMASAPPTTCRLVAMTPLDSNTKPLPKADASPPAYAVTVTTDFCASAAISRGLSSVCANAAGAATEATAAAATIARDGLVLTIATVTRCAPRSLLPQSYPSGACLAVTHLPMSRPMKDYDRGLPAASAEIRAL